MPCNHMIAIFENFENINWDSLPAHYKASPYFSLDESVIYGDETKTKIQPSDDSEKCSFFEPENSAIRRNTEKRISKAFKCWSL